MENLPEQLSRAHEFAVVQSKIEAAEREEEHQSERERLRVEREALERAQQPARQIEKLILPRYPDGILDEYDWQQSADEPVRRMMISARWGKQQKLFNERFTITAPEKCDYSLRLQLEGSVAYKRDMSKGSSTAAVWFPVNVSLVMTDENGDSSTQKLATVCFPEHLKQTPEKQYPWVTIDSSWELEATQHTELQEQVIAWIGEASEGGA